MPFHLTFEEPGTPEPPKRGPEPLLWVFGIAILLIACLLFDSRFDPEGRAVAALLGILAFVHAHL